MPLSGFALAGERYLGSVTVIARFGARVHASRSQERTSMERARLCAGLALATLCLSACGSGDRSDASDTRAGLTPDQAAARVHGSIGDPAVREVRVITDPANSPASVPWVRTYLAENAGHPEYRFWLGNLVEGAVAELMRTTQPSLAEVIGGGDVVHEGPHGPKVSPPLGMGIATREYFHSPSDIDLRARVNRVADDLGLMVMSVKILHPLDSALVVTFAVPSGDRPQLLAQLNRGLMGSPVDIEGLYYELDAPSGKPLVRSGVRERIKGGGIWVARGRGDRFEFNHG